MEERGRPKLLQAFFDAFRVPDLRARLLFTLALLVAFRFIAHIPVPGVDAATLERLTSFFRETPLMGMLDLFSGGAMRNMSVAAMGVYPYITASIVMQLLIPLIPRLQAMSKEGEAGRQRLSVITHWVTVPLAAAQAYGQLVLLRQQGVLFPHFTPEGFPNPGPSPLTIMTVVISMTAGTMFLVWLGQLITERGIGNGISLIIFGGIVSGLPSMVGQGLITLSAGSPGGVLRFLILGVLIVLVIVVFTEAQRRIPVQYGRSLFRSGRMYRSAGASHIPLRVNSAGMIPLIFAMSIMIFPGTIASYLVGSSVPWLANGARAVQNLFNTTGSLYWGLYFLLVVAFTFFYTMVIFQQQNIAENLQKYGGFIPGIRPGKPTSDYLNRVITRITWGGALFLGAVAIMPFFAPQVTNAPTLQISSTGLLIVVGVVLDTMRQLEAQLLMRHYEGFIR